MKSRIAPIFALLLVCSINGAAQVSVTAIHADISFDFRIDKEVLPAGTYSFDMKNPDVVIIRNVKTGKSVMPSVLTRTSQIPGDDAQVVFDKVGQEYYLAELHAVGMDGYHFKGAPGPHSHVIVRSK